MMAKNIRRILAMIMVLCVFAGAMPLQALAADGTVTEPSTEISPEGLTTDVVTTTTTATDAQGNTTVTITIDKTTEGNVAENVTLERNETSTTTTTTNAAGEQTGESWVEDGSEKKTETKVPTGTVDVPLTDVDDPETSETENQNSLAQGDPTGKETVTGDLPTSEDDTSYDYTTETVVQQGNITVTTEEIEFTDFVEGEIGDLEYTVSEVTPVKGNAEGEIDNDLIIWIFRNNRTELPEEGETVEVKDGYAYKYLGSGNTSQILSAFLYKSPSPDDPDEEPVFTDGDGNNYYLRGRNAASFNEYYIDGEKVESEGNVPGVFSVPQQFVLVDAATGELITTYCADADTPTENGFNYNIENLEDATYYNKAQAAMIRTIAANGYWGTEGTEVDKDGNTVPKAGSLEAMRAGLLESGKFNEEELKLLTDGVALAATQMAIWTYSNAMSDMEFLNALYATDGNDNNEVFTSWASQLVDSQGLDGEKKDLLFKLYNHMINMEPTEVQKTTAETIINADNFLKDMSVTVVQKAENHSNNSDNDDTNDAYVTNLTFALVVTPSEENEDNLVVKVVDKGGKVIASGRIAGVPEEGETMLIPDDFGNYSFNGITMIEGEQNFNISLEGVQNLKEGVYLYTSEVVTDEGGSTSSQTMVGLASGSRGVNVSMNIAFNLNVDDEIVATERVWHYESDPQVVTYEYPPEDEEPVPQVFHIENDEEIIPDEEVPLAAAPVTGDMSNMWTTVILAAVFGLFIMKITEKKRSNTSF